MQITVQVSQDSFDADNELINDMTNSVDPDSRAEPVEKPEKEDEAEQQLEQEAKDLEAFKSNVRSWVRETSRSRLFCARCQSHGRPGQRP